MPIIIKNVLDTMANLFLFIKLNYYFTYLNYFKFKKYKKEKDYLFLSLFLSLKYFNHEFYYFV